MGVIFLIFISDCLEKNAINLRQSSNESKFSWTSIFATRNNSFMSLFDLKESVPFLCGLGIVSHGVKKKKPAFSISTIWTLNSNSMDKLKCLPFFSFIKILFFSILLNFFYSLGLWFRWKTHLFNFIELLSFTIFKGNTIEDCISYLSCTKHKLCITYIKFP